MKKCFKSIFLLALSVSLVFSVSFADGEDMTGAPELTAKSALLMENSTGKILFENNSHEKLPLASVTKIMTMLLTMEAIDGGTLKYEDIVTGSAHAKSMGGSTIFLDEGEQISVHDLLKGIAVASGNDAAVAIAEHIAGSEEGFVVLMNKRAKELGMNDTNFVNCNGLDAEGHYSTAYDIALMSRELLKHPDIHNFTTIWMDTLRNGEFTLSNTNKLIRFYEGATGLKTGSTDKALFCISATAKRNNMHLIAVTMASPTSKDRASDASKLLNYGFATYSIDTVTQKDEMIDVVSVAKGVKSTTQVVAKDNFDYLLKKNEKADIEKKVTVNTDIKAPVKAGDKVGSIDYYSGGKKIGTVDVVFSEDIERITVHDTFTKIAGIWLGEKTR